MFDDVALRECEVREAIREARARKREGVGIPTQEGHERHLTLFDRRRGGKFTEIHRYGCFSALVERFTAPLAPSTTKRAPRRRARPVDPGHADAA